MIYLLRVGPFGQIGRFRSQFEFQPVHGQMVICRTPRGLEVGEFLSSYEDDGVESIDSVDGEFVRTMTSQDKLLTERLNKNRLSAIDECQRLIDDQSLPIAILDAELTFDGSGLYFYFSGEVDARLDAITDSLAEAYDAKVRFSEFADSLAQGCGPDCGTSAGGCSESGCASCGLKSACGQKG